MILDRSDRLLGIQAGTTHRLLEPIPLGHGERKQQVEACERRVAGSTGQDFVVGSLQSTVVSRKRLATDDRRLMTDEVGGVDGTRTLIGAFF
jgi:hypothetical protein